MSIRINVNNIEKGLQKSLPYFFGLLFLTTIVGSFSGYLEHNSWKIGDWLINYQGGIVRRGLLGELFFHLACFTHINPGLYVVIFQIFFYFVFFLFAYLLIRKQCFLIPYAFLIFSPFIFTFQIIDLQGGYRKEIIYFALLAFIAWSESTMKKRSFEKLFYMILLFYPLIILSHEMLLIFLPYLLVFYVLRTSLNTKNIVFLGLLLVPSIISFLVSVYYSGTEAHVSKIFNSIANENYTLTGGAIYSLSGNIHTGFASVLNRLNNQHYIGYIFITLIACTYYIPLLGKLNIIVKKSKLSFALMLSSIFGSIGLFLVAVDWGRFIYIHFVSIFFILLIPLEENEKIILKYQHTYARQVSTILIVFILFFHIPHCGSPLKSFPKSYKYLNVICFAKPYAKIAMYYYPELIPFFLGNRRISSSQTLQLPSCAPTQADASFSPVQVK